jgi:hypothetical protein
LPRLSEFYGIVIYMYFRDHAPPHFHATYGSDEAVVAIHSARLIAGRLPKRALGLVMTWARLHRDQLLANWAAAQEARPLEPIDPLN